MEQLLAEAAYPLYFREDITKLLADHIAHRRSVELIGMKRVGINNFLHFFLYNKQAHKKYLLDQQDNLFILVDLDDLIERELFPFWRLLFKRIVDAVEQSKLTESIKKRVSQLFIASIQSGDLFLTYDGVRDALITIAKEANPTIFFTRFDRLHNVVTPEFFNNLESLREATSNKLSYIFTSFRELDAIAPNVFHKKSFYGFTHVMYMQPASYQDVEIMLLTFLERFNVKLTKQISELIIDMSGGHAQYLQLLLIILDELTRNKKKTFGEKEFAQAVSSDERVMLLSEELWENLLPEEQEALQAIVHGKRLTVTQKEQARYIWDTGIVQVKGKQQEIFTSLFTEFLLRKGQEKEASGVDLSKKEHTLFTLLKENLNEICEREKIVTIVWPEYKEYGVSDWSIDRLIARVRSKLKKQKSPYEIVTVRTRGYKLTSS